MTLLLENDKEKEFLFKRAKANGNILNNFDESCLAMMRGYTHIIESEVVSEKTLYEYVCKSQLDSKIVLLPEQYKQLILLEQSNQKFIFFSAPTSFGKTFLTFEHIMRNRNKYNKIIFVSPTLALGDEITTNIDKYFGREYSDNPKNKKFMRAFTNEEFLKFYSENKEELESVDLVVFDEVYKLSESLADEKNKRKYAMSRSFCLLSEITNKFIALSPYVKIKTRQEHVQLKTEFSPTLQCIHNEIYRQDCHKNDVFQLAYGRSGHRKESNLIYVPKPTDIQEYIEEICINNISFSKNGNEIEIILSWIEENISCEWYVYRAIQSGMGVHCGPMPAFVKKMMLYLFEKKQIRNIICTSTLMEGINTNADNVIIPYISEPKLELNMFSFRNLSGRAGRLGKNIIGNIFIYQDIIQEDFNEVELWVETKTADNHENFDKAIVRNDSENDVKEEYKRLYKNLMEILGNYNLSYEWYVDVVAKARGYEKFKKIVNKYEKIREETKKFKNNYVKPPSKQKHYSAVYNFIAKERFNTYQLHKLIYTEIMNKISGQEFSVMAPGIIYDFFSEQNYFNVFGYIKKIINYENSSEDEKINMNLRDDEIGRIARYKKKIPNVNTRIELIFKILNFFENDYRNQVDIIEKIVENDKTLPAPIKIRFSEDYFKKIHALSTDECLIRRRMLDFGLLPTVVSKLINDTINGMRTLSFKQSLIKAAKGKSFNEFEQLNLKTCGLA